MMCRLNIGKSGFLFAGLCIAVFLASLLTAAGQSSDTSASDRQYCVSMGYLYRTSPSVNNGQGFCEFPSGGWCDAHAFATGQCAPNTYGLYNPYYYTAPPSGTALAEASNRCQASGGRVENVHTPYGDVDVCVFPNGNTVDLYQLYNGVWRSDAAWWYYAQSWLNAP